MPGVEGVDMLGQGFHILLADLYLPGADAGGVDEDDILRLAVLDGDLRELFGIAAAVDLGAAEGVI